jgi:hypothetical protein
VLLHQLQDRENLASRAEKAEKMLNPALLMQHGGQNH